MNEQIKVVSFDMQGTLTNSNFSDEFWLEVIPQFYAHKKNITIVNAKKELRKMFEKFGKYDYRYYSASYWMNLLADGKKFDARLMKNKPEFYDDVIEVLKSLKGKVKLIIITTTTKEFIDAELGGNKKYFDKIFSSIDDFDIAGKTSKVYEKVADVMKVKPCEIFHIGDSFEMDVQNAVKAGVNAFYFDNKKSRKFLIEQLVKVFIERIKYNKRQK